MFQNVTCYSPSHISDSTITLLNFEKHQHSTCHVIAMQEEGEFKVADGWLCPAVQVAVKSMKQGEVVRLRVRCRPLFDPGPSCACA